MPSVPKKAKPRVAKKDPSLPVPVLEPVLTLPRPRGIWYATGLILSLLVPACGLALGFVYAQQKDASTRNFGRLCLGFALAAWALSGLFGAFQGASNDGEWLVQPYN